MCRISKKVLEWTFTIFNKFTRTKNLLFWSELIEKKMFYEFWEKLMIWSKKFLNDENFFFRIFTLLEFSKKLMFRLELIKKMLYDVNIPLLNFEEKKNRLFLNQKWWKKKVSLWIFSWFFLFEFWKNCCCLSKMMEKNCSSLNLFSLNIQKKWISKS